jgi:hypothetical protein
MVKAGIPLLGCHPTGCHTPSSATPFIIESHVVAGVTKSLAARQAGQASANDSDTHRYPEILTLT